jgi:DNA-binding transcriptional ArsR family regulator
MRNIPIQETRLVGDGIRTLAALLPASWALETKAGAGGARSVDAIVELAAPAGERIRFAVEAKRSGSAPTALLITALRELARETSLPVLFVSDYIGPSLRAALTEEGICFADATGWVRLASEDPLIVLTGQGAEKSPRPARPGAVLRLNGVAANRTIRALCTMSMPVGVRELADAADVSPGSVSKLLVTLTTEGIVDRDERGRVITVRRRALIKRWTRDYSFTKANTGVAYCIAPRGLDRTLASLGTAQTLSVLTGSAAARRLLPAGTTSTVPLRLLALYTPRPGAVADELGLIDAEPVTANVVLVAPQDPSIIVPSATDAAEPALAPVALVIADLLTLPNRSDAEANQLMESLAHDDSLWSQ